MKFFKLLLTLLLLLLPNHIQAKEPKLLKWSDLIPTEHRTADPLAHLPQQTIDDIEWIIYLRQNLTAIVTKEEQQYYDEMLEAVPRLKEHGIDIDKIIAERKVKETAINTELDGRYVSIPGYLLPLQMNSNRVSEFLLVPFVGACIHVPPPPPNQIVQGTIDEAIRYNMEDLFKPIWITGTIKAKAITKELFLVDGSDDIDIGYVMAVDKISEYISPGL